MLALSPCQAYPEANNWLTAFTMLSEYPLLHSGLICVSSACLIEITVNGCETMAPAIPATPAITAFYLQLKSLQGFTGFTWLQIMAQTVFLTKRQLNLPIRCASNPSQRPESPAPVSWTCLRILKGLQPCCWADIGADFTSTASETHSNRLELDDGFEEFHGVGDEGGNCACDEGDGGGLEVGRLPISLV